MVEDMFTGWFCRETMPEWSIRSYHRQSDRRVLTVDKELGTDTYEVFYLTEDINDNTHVGRGLSKDEAIKAAHEFMDENPR